MQDLTPMFGFDSELQSDSDPHISRQNLDKSGPSKPDPPPPTVSKYHSRVASNFLNYQKHAFRRILARFLLN